MTFKEVYNKVMPEKKRKEERFNIFAHWIGRPISILMTLPLIETKIKPTTITFFSILFAITGGVLVSFGKIWWIIVIGWFCFFMWNLLDGVDGNLARCTDQCSQRGDLWDTTAGYIAMVLTYFSAGIAAFYDKAPVLQFLDPYWFLIIGGFTSLMSIFPRLVMHKKKSYGNNDPSVNNLSDKTKFGFKQIIAMNLISPSGFMQVIFLVVLLTHTINFFICAYFVINLGVMLISLFKLLR